MACMAEEGIVSGFKQGNLKEKKVTRCSRDGTIEMDFKERGWKGVNWNHLTLNGISRGLL